MRQTILPALAITLMCPGMPASARPAPPRIPETLSPKLAKVLAGRTAGRPTECISLRPQLQSQIIDETAIVYKDSARRWYVTFPNRGNCAGLTPARTIVTRTPGTQLCSGDLARVVDLPMGFDYGACALGPFVPYTR